MDVVVEFAFAINIMQNIKGEKSKRKRQKKGGLVNDELTLINTLNTMTTTTIITNGLQSIKFLLYFYF